MTEENKMFTSDLDNLKRELNCLKTELKCWETMFYRSRGRKPTKEDIDSSGHEIKATYKKYSQIRNEFNKQRQLDDASCTDTTKLLKSDINKDKNGNLEKSHLEAVDDDVFGTKFNKTKDEKLTKPTHLREHNLSEKKKSLLRKRHLKLPLEKNNVQVNNKAETIADQNKINVINAGSENVLKIPDECNVGEICVKEQLTGHVKITSCDANPFQSRKFAKSNPKSKHSLSRNYKISEKWLQKYNTITSELENEEKIEDLCENAEIAHNLPTKNRASKVPDRIEFEHTSIEEHLKDLHGTENVGSLESLERFQDNQIINKNENEDNFCNINNEQSKKTQLLKKIDNLKQNDHLSKRNLKESEDNRNSTNDNLVTKTQCLETHKAGNEIQLLQNVGFRQETSPSPITVENKPIHGARQKRKAEESCQSPLQGDTHCNISSGTNDVKIFNDRKKRKTDNSVGDKAEMNIPRGKRLVSENFVRIDIQKKKFCRGKRRVKASTYKRQQWKKKTQFNSKTTASCFKCGQEGHWAKECAKRTYKGRQTYGSTFNGKSNEDYLPMDASSVIEDVGFSLAEVPDLPRCWPRIPYEFKTSAMAIPPLFEPIDNQPSKEAFHAINTTLLAFGYNSFRYGQETAIARIVSGLSTLLVLSTGSGKSLCYQLPAYLYFKQEKFLTIVISPLVALMEDQVSNLPYGLKGACLHTNMTKQQREKVIRDLSDRKIAILLLSPEALVSGTSATGYMPMLGCLPPIAFACIDEAHCVSEWSHNFRPEYLRVCKVLRQQLGVKCLLGLTATATKATSISIAKHLGIEEATSTCSIIRRPMLPDNLHLTVSRDADRDKALVSLLSGPRFESCISIIIYCTRREETERLSSMLRTCLQSLPPTQLDSGDEDETLLKVKSKGKLKKSKKPKIRCVFWDAECYHAGMTPAQRRRVQKKFMSGELRIVVATSAFGMGVDKSNVRAIIHYNMPKSFESYLQEVGRAGRDGASAHCHVFLDNDAKDISELRRHIYSNSVDRKAVKKLVNKIFKSCDCKERSLDDNSNTSEVSINIDRKASAIDTCQDGCNSVKIQMTDLEVLNESLENVGSSNIVGCDDELPTLNDLEADGDVMVNEERRRCCTGHHTTFSIESTVQDLDMPEENISTLLCYLELQPKSLIKLMNPIKSKCTVKCYGGSKQMKILASKFLPLTAVFNHMKREKLCLSDSKCITFDIVEIADEMNWDLDPVYRDFRSIQWNTQFSLDSCDAQIGKSGVLVEFEDLSYHLISPGDLTDDERDCFTELLFKMTEDQEETRLLQLDALYNVLSISSHDDYYEILSKHDKASDLKLRGSIKQYFDCDPLDMKQLLQQLCPQRINTYIPETIWGSVARDVRTMTGLHHDVIFTGRSLARIFHGINSPCFPATVWGRDRKFWRRYLDVDFNELRRFITNEMIRFRC